MFSVNYVREKYKVEDTKNTKHVTLDGRAGLI